jgi:hypothetical protein
LKTGAETAAASAPMVTVAWANMNASGEVISDDKNMPYHFASMAS